MNNIDLKIIVLRLSALPVGIFICACSCALTCRFLILGAPVPSLAGQWWQDPEALSYIVKLSGGLAVSAAQVFGLAIYNLKRDCFWKWLYIGATSVSVTISVLTFQSMIQSGAINAKRNTAEYQSMTADRDRLIDAITGQRKREQAIVEKYTSINWMDVASKKEAEYERRILVYEAKLSDLQKKLADYTVSMDTKDFVSASTTYDALGNDVVTLFGLPRWVGLKFSFLLSYVMLIAVALAIDLTGTKLFSFAIGEAELEMTPAPVKTQGPHLQSGAQINDTMAAPVPKYIYQPLTPYEKLKIKYEKIADSYTGAVSGTETDSPTGAEETQGGAESGAQIEQSRQLSMDIDPELLGRIIDAYNTEKSINAIQNKVWETGKSSRRREIVLAVGEAYGLHVDNGNGQNRLAAWH